MKDISTTTKAIVFNNVSELSLEDGFLMEQAKVAREKAYAPYSKFKVGCAVLLDNGLIIEGNNQENAAYPSGMCAERVAIWKAGSQYPDMKVKRIAITAASSIVKVNSPVGPCGACRQTLSEYEVNQKEEIEMLFMGEVGEVIKVTSLLSLLPFAFTGASLE